MEGQVVAEVAVAVAVAVGSAVAGPAAFCRQVISQKGDGVSK